MASVEEAHPFVEANLFPPRELLMAPVLFVEPILSVEASQVHSQLVWSSRVLPCQAFSCVCVEFPEGPQARLFRRLAISE